LAKDATTRARVARLSALLSGDPVTVEGAVALLRDRSTANTADGGFGNRNALAGDIAAHSVIFELGKRRAWVAAAPHTSGAYIPVDLEAVLADDRGTSPLPAPVVPAEPALRSGELEAYFAARRALLEGDAEEAVRLCPRFAEALALLGEEVAHRGDRARARALLERALAMDPGPRSYREDLERLLAAVAGTGPLPERRLRRQLSPDELIRASGVVDEP
ncbi:MAG: hypothetical protein JNK60_18990, partial [Acidobacteria bacterium]|nr:hypothetical protein [Acidobacteriota bacterium]